MVHNDKEPPVAQRSDRAEAAHTPHSPIGALDPREIRGLIRKVGDLQKAVAQRDALINLYQQRVEALSAELQSRKRGWFKFFGR
jgi:ABC-type Fe3+-hydroxamate transport system substrate-binding protein